MRSLGWTLIQYPWCPSKKRSGHRHTGGDHVGRQGEGGHLKAKGKTNFVDTWISDFWPPELRGNKFIVWATQAVELCYGSPSRGMHRAKLTCQYLLIFPLAPFSFPRAATCSLLSPACLPVCILGAHAEAWGSGCGCLYFHVTSLCSL